ncbi:Cyclin-dependent kinase-like 2 [Armadillidium vulgare]|nr:Cyclin-dependent kinase-like 2 [Armadillidium vulgare]
MLKKVRHENLVNLIEFFRRKRRLYLVFEYVDHTVLDELEAVESGLDADTARSHIFQVIRGVAFCHENQIIHRDVKPENVLVSQLGVVKLCDFGFARILEGPNESCTDYVATRWYRAPELLVGDTKYGREVDIWAIGCLLAEILSGEPLFPGESDIDQLFHIIQTLGELSSSHQNLVSKNPMLSGLRMPNAATTPLSETFPKWSDKTMLFISECLDLTPGKRPSAEQLLKHDYFLHDSFPETFLPQLRKKVQQEFNSNLLIQFSNTRKSSGQNDKKQKKGKNDFYESHSQRVAPKPIQHLTGRLFGQKQSNSIVSTTQPSTVSYTSITYTLSKSSAIPTGSTSPSKTFVSSNIQHTFSNPNSSSNLNSPLHQISSSNLIPSSIPSSSFNGINTLSSCTSSANRTNSPNKNNSSAHLLYTSNPSSINDGPFPNRTQIPSQNHNEPSFQRTSQPYSQNPNQSSQDPYSLSHSNGQSQPSSRSHSIANKSFITYTALTTNTNSSRFNVFPFDDGPLSLPFSHIPPLKDIGLNNGTVVGNGNNPSALSSSFVRNGGASNPSNSQYAASPKHKDKKEERSRNAAQVLSNPSSNLKNQNLLIKGQCQFHIYNFSPNESSTPLGSTIKEGTNGNNAVPSHVDNSQFNDQISPFSRHHHPFDFTRHPYAISLDRTKELTVRDPLREIKDNAKDSKKTLFNSSESKDLIRKSKIEASCRQKPKQINDDLYLPHLLTVSGKTSSPKKSAEKEPIYIEGVSEVSQTKIKKNDFAMPILGGLDRSSASSIDSTGTVRRGSNFPSF